MEPEDRGQMLHASGFNEAEKVNRDLSTLFGVGQIDRLFQIFRKLADSGGLMSRQNFGLLLSALEVKVPSAIETRIYEAIMKDQALEEDAVTEGLKFESFIKFFNQERDRTNWSKMVINLIDIQKKGFIYFQDLVDFFQDIDPFCDCLKKAKKVWDIDNKVKGDEGYEYPKTSILIKGTELQALVEALILIPDEDAKLRKNLKKLEWKVSDLMDPKFWPTSLTRRAKISGQHSLIPSNNMSDAPNDSQTLTSQNIEASINAEIEEELKLLQNKRSLLMNGFQLDSIGAFEDTKGLQGPSSEEHARLIVGHPKTQSSAPSSRQLKFPDLSDLHRFLYSNAEHSSMVEEIEDEQQEETSVTCCLSDPSTAEKKFDAD